MREILSWIAGAFLAFLLTAGAFLLLANAGGSPSEKSLRPGPASAGSGPSLEIQLPQERLSSLEQSPDQSLSIGVHNSGDEKLSDINISVKVSSENTALSVARYYRSSVETLAAGETVPREFTLDLAVSEQSPEPARAIIEIRATTPSGVSSVRTVILPA